MKIYDFNIASFCWILYVTSLQEADKSPKGCVTVWFAQIRKVLQSKNSFAENFLYREKKPSDNSKILHSFRWKCFIQWLNVNAVKESRKKICKFCYLWPQFSAVNQHRRHLMKVLWDLITKQEELIFSS